jgi:hypothetical protein
MFPESTSVLLLQEEGLYALLQFLRRYVLDMGGGLPKGRLIFVILPHGEMMGFGGKAMMKKE